MNELIWILTFPIDNILLHEGQRSDSNCDNHKDEKFIYRNKCEVRIDINTCRFNPTKGYGSPTSADYGIINI